MSDFTAAEQANVRKALQFTRVGSGGWDTQAKALHAHKKTLRRPASASAAVRVARLAGVGVDDVLTGKYPVPGVRPPRAPEEAAQ